MEGAGLGEEQPTNGELGRRLDTIQLTLAALVGRAEYASDLRASEHRLAGLAADIEDTRRQHAEDMRAVHERITQAEQDSRAHRLSWRTAFWNGILPAMVVLGGILVQIWLAHSGGTHP